MSSIHYRPFKKNVESWELIIDDVEKLKDTKKRHLVDVKIGEGTENGENFEVIEKCYLDIIKDTIVNHSPYKTVVELGNEPQLVITLGNNVVRHNPEIQKYADDIKDIFSQIDKNILFKAFKSLRMNKEQLRSRKEASVKMLMAMIEEKSKKKYAPSLVQALLMEYFEEERKEDCDVCDMTYEELLETAIELETYRETKTTGDNLDELQKSMSIEDIEKKVIEEIYNRFLCGSIREVK